MKERNLVQVCQGNSLSMLPYACSPHSRCYLKQMTISNACVYLASLNSKWFQLFTGSNTPHRFNPDCSHRRFRWKDGLVHGFLIARAQKTGLSRDYGVLSLVNKRFRFMNGYYWVYLQYDARLRGFQWVLSKEERGRVALEISLHSFRFSFFERLPCKPFHIYSNDAPSKTVLWSNRGFH